MKVLAYDAGRAVIEALRRSEGARRMLCRGLFGKKANYYYREGEA